MNSLNVIGLIVIFLAIGFLMFHLDSIITPTLFIVGSVIFIIGISIDLMKLNKGVVERKGETQ